MGKPKQKSTIPQFTKPFSPRDIASIYAYLMTTFEARGETPMFGTAVLSEIVTAWSSPGLLRNMLPTRLRARYDYWMATGMSQQLDLFSEDV